MSQENVEVVRAILDGWLRRDFEGAFELIDPDVEWFGPPDVTGSDTQHGHTGVRRALATWFSAWEEDDYHFEVRELTDAGDNVLAEAWQRVRGRGSGVEVSEEIFTVWTVRAGKVVRQRMFRDRAQALEAAGLSE